MRQARFLVLRGGAIGDFIVTLPALQALRDRWPDAFIEVAGYPHVAELARLGGLADTVSSLDRAGVARFFSHQPQFEPAQVSWIRSFDIIFTYLHDPGEIVRENLKLAGARQVVYGSPIMESAHAVDHLLKPLESLAIYIQGESPRLQLPDEHRRKARARLDALGVSKPLMIHPGSGSAGKNWMLDRFIQVARMQESALFLLGEAEDEFARRLAQEFPDTHVLANLPLFDAAAILSECGGYLGNDSGITHLAAALGLPTVAIFGPSRADIWSPRGRRVRVIEAPEGKLDRVSVDAVRAALAEFGSVR